jgi:hypothetical protein
MCREEIEAARALGGGNISMGFRWALRYANDRNMHPIELSTLLRSAAVLAEELEQRDPERKARLSAQAKAARSYRQANR